jgi:hypothetical protein
MIKWCEDCRQVGFMRPRCSILSFESPMHDPPTLGRAAAARLAAAIQQASDLEQSRQVAAGS